MRKCQVLVHECVRELRRDWLSGYQDPVVDGTDELVGREVDVGVLREFAAALGAPEGRLVTNALRRHELGAEAGRDLWVVLGLPCQRAADRAGVGVRQEHGQLAKVMAEVAAVLPAFAPRSRTEPPSFRAKDW
jgi:hypothetical protein